ncbi:WGxxGxxG family protein [Fortiea contorta]|uniref:WGxxGxxG family protein n=1 Tax=Fortiea contorta TaxID=1892405 RepID=UPI0003455601|nr:WGxxGxxG family protein [Fortiea contorta]
MTHNLSKLVGTGILTLSMAILPLTLVAQAQVTTPPRTDVAPRTTTTYDNRNDFDWGWLGLIGLLGLAGLTARKHNDEPTRYRDPNAPGATSYRD